MPFSFGNLKGLFGGGGAATPSPHVTGPDSAPTFARLKELGAQTKPPFTSNLSVNELAIMLGQGAHPVAQVQGSCVYHVGWQYMGSLWAYDARELTVISDAYRNAWGLATSRLVQQASIVGSHTVVGTKMSRESLDSGYSDAEYDVPSVVEVSLIGTAVRVDSGPPRGGATMTTLNAQDYLALRASGYAPAGIAYGCCVFYEPTYWYCSYTNAGAYGYGQMMINQEQSDYSHAFRYARKEAQRQMERHAGQLGADGILDTTIHFTITPMETEDSNKNIIRAVVIVFECFGTAVVRFGDATASGIDTAVILNDD
jgi:uncharacterized protein YbjQ (UPF0145 family)